jgi:hypothetical protein
MRDYGVELAAWDDLPRADAIVADVAHRGLGLRAGTVRSKS